MNLETVPAGVEFRRSILESCWLQWTQSANRLMVAARLGIKNCGVLYLAPHLLGYLREFYDIHHELTEVFGYRTPDRGPFLESCLAFGPVYKRDRKLGRPSDEGRELLSKVGQAAFAEFVGA